MDDSEPILTDELLSYLVKISASCEIILDDATKEDKCAHEFSTLLGTRSLESFTRALRTLLAYRITSLSAMGDILRRSKELAFVTSLKCGFACVLEALASSNIRSLTQFVDEGENLINSAISGDSDDAFSDDSEDSARSEASETLSSEAGDPDSRPPLVDMSGHLEPSLLHESIVDAVRTQDAQQPMETYDDVILVPGATSSSSSQAIGKTGITAQAVEVSAGEAPSLTEEDEDDIVRGSYRPDLTPRLEPTDGAVPSGKKRAKRLRSAKKIIQEKVTRGDKEGLARDSVQNATTPVDIMAVCGTSILAVTPPIIVVAGDPTRGDSEPEGITVSHAQHLASVDAQETRQPIEKGDEFELPPLLPEHSTPRRRRRKRPVTDPKTQLSSTKISRNIEKSRDVTQTFGGIRATLLLRSLSKYQSTKELLGPPSSKRDGPQRIRDRMMIKFIEKFKTRHPHRERVSGGSTTPQSNAAPSPQSNMSALASLRNGCVPESPDHSQLPVGDVLRITGHDIDVPVESIVLGNDTRLASKSLLKPHGNGRSLSRSFVSNATARSEQIPPPSEEELSLLTSQSIPAGQLLPSDEEDSSTASSKLDTKNRADTIKELIVRLASHNHQSYEFRLKYACLSELLGQVEADRVAVTVSTILHLMDRGDIYIVQPRLTDKQVFIFPRGQAPV